MPQVIALLFCGMFVLVAFVGDYRRESNVSDALWVPLIWLSIVASRPIGVWFKPSNQINFNPEEGSIIDLTVLTVLICLAAIVLQSRNFRWIQWLRGNSWLCLFFLYCGISILWSDYPLIAFKRWVRAVGSLMMIFVVLSESDPIAALGALVRRCAYLLVPVSLLIIKYYRSMGVGYNFWTGEEYLAGVTTDKNALGRLCLVTGLFLIWEFVKTQQNKNLGTGKVNRYINFIVFGILLWLLFKSKSSTSLGSLIIGVSLLIGLGLPFIKTKLKYIGTFVVFAILIIFISDQFGFIEFVVITLLGRNMTFTDRIYIWKDLMKTGTDPLFGVGYDSFWLGERLVSFAQKHQVNEAHNGYLEVYLELGTIGLFLFSGFLVTTFFKAKHSLLLNFDYGRLRFAFLFIFLFYNVTESAYKSSTLMFFMLMLIAIEVPRQSTTSPMGKGFAGVTRKTASRSKKRL